MKISVVGCGYLGAVHAATMAQLGHDVVGIDVDAPKVEALQQGSAPFYEPGLRRAADGDGATGRLTFSTDIADGGGRARPLRLRRDAAEARRVRRGPALRRRGGRGAAARAAAGDVVVGQVDGAGRHRRAARRGARAVPGAMLAWNPEFLREGFAVEDTLHPDRLVYGLPDGERADRGAGAARRGLRADRRRTARRMVVTDYATAELVKVAANSFLATKISFINAMAELCEATGADVTQLADAIGYDDRIGRRFLNAGLGLRRRLPAEGHPGVHGAGRGARGGRGADASCGRSTRSTCGAGSGWSSWPARSATARSLGKRVAVLGAAFKPNSDDVRDSPALNVAAQLQLQGATVRVTDPAAVENCRRMWPQLDYADTPEEAAERADRGAARSPSGREYRELRPRGVRRGRGAAAGARRAQRARSGPLGGGRLDLPGAGTAELSLSRT